MSRAKKDFLLVLSSQVISMAVSIVRSLVLPYFLTITAFGYFQSYLLYISYAPFFCLGYNDGVYLRYGDKKYEDLPVQRIAAPNLLFTLMLIFFGLIINIVSFFVVHDSNLSFALLMSTFYMVFLGLNTLILQIYQVTLQFKSYSIISILVRVLSLVCIVSLLLCGVLDYKYIVLVDLLTFSIITFYLVLANRKLFFAKHVFSSFSFDEFFESIRGGFPLMFANIMGMLILGLGQFAIQIYGGIEQFAQYRFGVSISSFILMAVSAASMVVYPMLKRMDSDHQRQKYGEFSELLDKTIILVIPIYYMAVFLIKSLYIEYEGLIPYFGVLLCIVFFQSKIYIVQNSFYKALRLEKSLFTDNLISLASSFILLVIFYSLFRSPSVVAIVSLGAICIRYFITLHKLNPLMDYTNNPITVELIILLIFIFTTLLVPFIPGMVINVLTLLIYIIMRRNQLLNIIKVLK